MEFNQDDKTKKFLQQAKNLVESGMEPTYKAIAEKVGWNHNSFSLTLNGRRNVPFEVYKKFTEVYKPEEESIPENNNDYKDKYITMLERQVKEQARQLAELKDRVDSRTLQITDQIDKLAVSLTGLARDQKAMMSYTKTMYQSMIEHRAALEGDSPKALKSRMDKLLADHFAQSGETGSR